MVIPHKRRRGSLLTVEQAAHNRKLSRGRVVVENAIKRLKDWRALKQPWRNRLFLHHVAFNVITQLTNVTLRVRPVRNEPHRVLYYNMQ
jgi:hypothetical protein